MKKRFHTSVQEAEMDGWFEVYFGNHGRVYGKKLNNHRVWRCYYL